MSKNPTEESPTSAYYGVAIHNSNPSVMPVGHITKPSRRKIGTDQKGLVIDGHGEILGAGVAVSYEFEEVDKERFVKLYLAGLKQAVGLSKAGLAVFQIVYDQLRNKKENDMVYMVAAGSGLSRPTYHRGLRELLEREFLYRSPNPTGFWVNIKYMFNGNRIAFVKGYQIQGTRTANQLNLFADEEAQGGGGNMPQEQGLHVPQDTQAERGRQNTPQDIPQAQEPAQEELLDFHAQTAALLAQAAAKLRVEDL
jgi:hypothetical protein